MSGVYTSEGTTERTRLLLRLIVVLDVQSDYQITIIQDRGLWFTQIGFESRD